jgi:tetratricopeptide (TPR) repeat protein
MSEADEAFGARLRRLRREAGLTQEALGAGTYTGGYVSQLEADKRGPSSRVIALFAERLKIDPGYLRTGIDPQQPIRLAIEVQEARAQVYEDPHTAAERLQGLVDEAKRRALPEVQAKALEALGFATERDGKTQEALALYQEAEALSVNLPLHARCGCVVGIARCFRLLGDPRYAVFVLENYLFQLEKESISDPSAIMRVNSTLIAVYFATGMLEQAVKAAEEAKRLEVRVSDPEQIGCMNLNVARALLFQGRTTDATVALRQAEDIFSSLGWKKEVARAAIAQGIIHAKVDELPEAKAALEEALELLGESPNSLDEAQARNELAKTERLLGNPSAARMHAEKVFELIPEGDPRERAFASREVALTSDLPEETEKYLKDAIDLYRIANDPIETAATFRALGDLHRRLGEIEAMADAYRSGLEAIEDRAY